MNRFSRQFYIACIAAVLYFFCSLWFFQTYTKVYYERSLGQSYEASVNPFLAAELLLKEREFEFEKYDNYTLFDQKPGDYDTVFIQSSRVGMTQSTTSKMRVWVEGGGHLVLLATEYYEYDREGSRDVFLDELGLRFYEDDEYYDEDERLTNFKFDDYDEETHVDFGQWYSNGYLIDDNGEAVFIGGNEHSDSMIQYELGEGLITVLTDFDQWTNYRIAQHDHAMFLLQLTGNSDKVWFVYQKNMPGLMSIIIDNALELSLSISIILFLIMFGNIWRKGAIRSDELPIQREIMQHIRAAGEFNYRLDDGYTLYDEMMQDISRLMEKKVYGFAKLSDADKIKKIHQYTQIKIEALKKLFNQEIENHNDFVSKVDLFQKIRKQI